MHSLKKILKTILIVVLLISLFPNRVMAENRDMLPGIDAFVNNFFNQYLKDYHVPGAAITIVKNDSIILKKGYGLADVEENIPVDPDKTLFKIASVSKPITAATLLKLAESGDIDLKRDINQYLGNIHVEEAFGKPITIANLLTHTSGFSQMNIGSGTRDKNKLLSLEEYFKTNMPKRIYPPDTFFTYSNQGISLAAYIAEKISGKPYYEVVEDTVFKPLLMQNSSFNQQYNPKQGINLAKGYGYNSATGEYVPIQHSYHHTYPAGGCVSTVADMANFIIMQLNHGVYGQSQILNEQSIRLMQETYFKHHPEVQGQTMGFWEKFDNKKRIIFHTGTTDGYASLIFLIPEDKLGFMLSYNSSSGKLRDKFQNEFMDYYYPASMPREDFGKIGQSDLMFYEGLYWNIEKSTKGLDKLEVLFSDGLLEVNASDQNSIRLSGVFGDDLGQYEYTGKDVFVNRERYNPIAFNAQAYEKDRLYLFYNNNAFRKLSWYENPYMYMLIGIVSILILIIILLIRIWQAFASRVKEKFSKVEKLLGHYVNVVSLLLIVFAATAGITMGSLGKYAFMFGIPLHIKVMLYLPLLVYLSLPFLLLSTVTVFKKKYWNRSGRLLYVIQVAGITGVMVFIHYWNMSVNPFQF